MRYRPFFILLLFAFVSCQKQPTWDIDGYIPLLKSNLYLQNALEDSLKSVGNNGELNLTYNSNLFSIKIDSLFAIPDTQVTELFNLPIGSITMVPGQTIVNDTQETYYNIQDIELRYVNIRSGEMSLEVNSTLSENSIITYALPYVTQNGVPFTFTQTVPAGSISSPSSISETFDLSGYDIDLRGLQQNSFNTLIYTYRAIVDPNGSNVTITTADYVQLNTSFTGLIPEYGRGYFGNRIETDASVDSLDLFRNFQGGNLEMDRASLLLTVTNQAGADVRLRINELTSINDYTNNTVPLDHDIIGGSINLSRAVEGGNNTPPINPQTYILDIDQLNSNIPDFFANLPTQLGYDMEVQLNPLGNVSNGNDFIYYNTGLEIGLDVEIPLRFSATNLILLDTTELEVDPDGREDIDPIQGGQILVHASNYYPFDAELQFYLMDSNYVILDSIFDVTQFLQGGIPENGRVTAPTRTTLAAPLTPDKTDHLYNTAFVEIHATINTVNQTNQYQLYDNYRVGLEVVGDFTYRIENQN